MMTKQQIDATTVPASLKRALLPRAETLWGISDERDSGDGYWIYLAAGWWCAGMGCGTIHEQKIDDVKKMLRTIERAPAGTPEADTSGATTCAPWHARKGS